MKTASKSSIPSAYYSFGGVVCAGAILLTVSSAPAQNLFVSDYLGNNIYEFTPGGVQSTFASGLNRPWGLAFSSTGNLFEADSVVAISMNLLRGSTKHLCLRIGQPLWRGL